MKKKLAVSRKKGEEKPSSRKNTQYWVRILLLNAFAACLVTAVLYAVLTINDDNIYLYEKGAGYKEGGVNILILLPTENYTDGSYFYTAQEFEKAGFGFDVAAPTEDWTHGERFYVKPQLTLDEVNADKYDAVLIPGGDGIRQYFYFNKRVLAIVEEFNRKNKTVASICRGGVILVQAGVVFGKNATGAPFDELVFRYGGATYVDRNVSIDGNIITARDDSNAQELALEVIKILK